MYDTFNQVTIKVKVILRLKCTRKQEISEDYYDYSQYPNFILRLVEAILIK